MNIEHFCSTVGFKKLQTLVDTTKTMPIKGIRRLQLLCTLSCLWCLISAETNDIRDGSAHRMLH